MVFPKLNLRLCRLALSSLVVPAGHASAGVVFDESAYGDFSDDRLNPSSVVLGVGSNLVSGRFGSSPTPEVHDLDYVTFRIEAGYRLASMTVASASVGGAFAFVGMQAGRGVTIPADWSSIETPLLGWAHFGSSTVGLDILPDMAASPGSVGFTPPLGAGECTLWIMELDYSEAHSYSFSLEVTAVPGPGVLAMSVAFAGCRRGRRRD